MFNLLQTKKGLKVCRGLKLKHQLITGCNDIAGCSILTGGKMAFINYHPSFLLILNVDGSQECKNVLLIRDAHDVACMVTQDQ
jgi:hypothetical protein